MKSRIYSYVAGVTTHANPCRGATTWVVSANPFFGFLIDLSLSWDPAAPSPADQF